MVHEKKVVDDANGWLTVYDDGSVDRTWNGPPEAKFMTETVPPHDQFINGIAVCDVTTTTTHRSDQRVRLYLPEKTVKDNKKLPILFHMHGGGFCMSAPDMFIYYNIYTQFVKTTRTICVSVYLRRAPEHRIPAIIDDALAALQWVQSVAKGDAKDPWLEEHGDFNRVFLMGDSSGGNLVHDLASKAGSTIDLSPIRIAGGIVVHPGFCRETRSRSELENPPTPILNLEQLDKLLSLALPVGSNKDHPVTCPMGSAAPPLEGLKLPPLLLCVAEKDLFRDTQLEYYEAMKKANKDVELFVSKGMTHCWYLNKIEMDSDPIVNAQKDALIGRVKEFIDKH